MTENLETSLMAINEDRFLILETQVEKISKIVIGNGEIGMAESQRAMAKDIKEIKDTLTTHVKRDSEEENRRKSRRERLLEKFLIGAVALLVSGIGTVIGYGFKLYPAIEKLLETLP